MKSWYILVLVQAVTAGQEPGRRLGPKPLLGFPPPPLIGDEETKSLTTDDLLFSILSTNPLRIYSYLNIQLRSPSACMAWNAPSSSLVAMLQRARGNNVPSPSVITPPGIESQWFGVATGESCAAVPAKAAGFAARCLGIYDTVGKMHNNAQHDPGSGPFIRRVTKVYPH